MTPNWLSTLNRVISRPDACLKGMSHADVAQLVAHHLAKVNVAGSSPVIRSAQVLEPRGGVAERRGKGLQIPLHGFKSRLHLNKFLDQNFIWSIGAVG